MLIRCVCEAENTLGFKHESTCLHENRKKENWHAEHLMDHKYILWNFLVYYTFVWSVALFLNPLRSFHSLCPRFHPHAARAFPTAFLPPFRLFKLYCALTTLPTPPVRLLLASPVQTSRLCVSLRPSHGLSVTPSANSLPLASLLTSFRHSCTYSCYPSPAVHLFTLLCHAYFSRTTLHLLAAPCASLRLLAPPCASLRLLAPH